MISYKRKNEQKKPNQQAAVHIFNLNCDIKLFQPLQIVLCLCVYNDNKHDIHSLTRSLIHIHTIWKHHQYMK